MILTKQPNHKCVICGVDYYACNQCDVLNGVGSWHKFCESQEHYKIYQVLQWYKASLISSAEAKEQLHKCDLENLNNFRVDVQHLIHGIIDEPEKIIINKPKEMLSKTAKRKNSENKL